MSQIDVCSAGPHRDLMLKVAIGDDDGDLDDDVARLVQTRHLQVHPDQRVLHQLRIPR